MTRLRRRRIPVATRRCVVCDTDVSRDIGRCTNGCCGQCHERFCTSPEHTIDVADAKSAWDKFYRARDDRGKA